LTAMQSGEIFCARLSSISQSVSGWLEGAAGRSYFFPISVVSVYLSYFFLSIKWLRKGWPWFKSPI